MKKVLIAIAMIVGIIVVPSVASAHHPLISGTTTCVENGLWSVNWVVQPDVARQDVDVADRLTERIQPVRFPGR